VQHKMRHRSDELLATPSQTLDRILSSFRGDLIVQTRKCESFHVNMTVTPKYSVSPYEYELELEATNKQFSKNMYLPSSPARLSGYATFWALRILQL
jgi:hypothetical protein